MAGSRIQTLGELVHEWRGVPEVLGMIEDLSAKLAAGTGPFEGLPLPERLVSGRLPSGIASAWVFVLRASHRNPAHFHPNSTQYTTAIRGGGMGFFGGEEVALRFFDAARPGETIYEIPSGTAHAFATGGDGLVVISFHTIAPELLVEIEVESTRRRTYLPGDGH